MWPLPGPMSNSRAMRPSRSTLTSASLPSVVTSTYAPSAVKRMPCGRVFLPRLIRRSNCPPWASYTPRVWPGSRWPYSLTTAVRPSRLTTISCGAGAVPASPSRRPSSRDNCHRVLAALLPTSSMPEGAPGRSAGAATAVPASAKRAARRRGNAIAMGGSPSPTYSGRPRRAAGLVRMQPLCRAIGIAFVFPDRRPQLDLVDHVTARVEGGVAMRGAGADPHRQPADRQLADPVHAVHAADGKAPGRFLDDALALGHRQAGIGLVAQAADRATVVVVADPASEAGVGAGLVAQQALAQRTDVDLRRGQFETGGAATCRAHLNLPRPAG